MNEERTNNKQTDNTHLPYTSCDFYEFAARNTYILNILHATMFTRPLKCILIKNIFWIYIFFLHITFYVETMSLAANHTVQPTNLYHFSQMP